MNAPTFKHRLADGSVEDISIHHVPTTVLQQSGSRMIFELLTLGGGLLDIDEELRRRDATVKKPPHFLRVLFDAVREVREAGEAPPANNLPI